MMPSPVSPNKATTGTISSDGDVDALPKKSRIASSRSAKEEEMSLTNSPASVAANSLDTISSAKTTRFSDSCDTGKEKAKKTMKDRSMKDRSMKDSSMKDRSSRKNRSSMDASKPRRVQQRATTTGTMEDRSMKDRSRNDRNRTSKSNSMDVSKPRRREGRSSSDPEITATQTNQSDSDLSMSDMSMQEESRKVKSIGKSKSMDGSRSRRERRSRETSRRRGTTIDHADELPPLAPLPPSGTVAPRRGSTLKRNTLGGHTHGGAEGPKLQVQFCDAVQVHSVANDSDVADKKWYSKNDLRQLMDHELKINWRLDDKSKKQSFALYLAWSRTHSKGVQ